MTSYESVMSVTLIMYFVKLVILGRGWQTPITPKPVVEYWVSLQEIPQNQPMRHFISPTVSLATTDIIGSNYHLNRLNQD